MIAASCTSARNFVAEKLKTGSKKVKYLMLIVIVKVQLSSRFIFSCFDTLSLWVENEINLMLFLKGFLLRQFYRDIVAFCIIQ